MKLLNNDIKVFLELPWDKDNTDILLGIHTMEGECEVCGEPAIALQLGFLIFTVTITVTKSHE